MQPLCVHVALNARYSPGLGWVTTTAWSLKILPPLTGMSRALPSVSAGDALGLPATGPSGGSSAPQAASRAAEQTPAAPARTVRLVVGWDIGVPPRLWRIDEGTVKLCALMGS